jgi:hypothetical protein
MEPPRGQAVFSGKSIQRDTAKEGYMKTPSLSRPVLMAVAGAATLFLGACGNDELADNDANEVGIEERADDIGDATEDSVEDAGDAIEDATDD